MSKETLTTMKTSKTGTVCEVRHRTWPKMTKLATGIAAVSVVLSLAGCGSSASANTTGQAAAAQTGQANQAASGSGFRRGGNFQPTIDMKTSPVIPSAGKQFTLTFSMQMPNRSPRNGNTAGSSGGYTGNHTGGYSGGYAGNSTSGYSGGYGGGNRTGNRAGGSFGGTPPTATVQIVGYGVNQTIGLSSQNRVFSGTTTLTNPGTYKATFTMDFGPRTITKQFTIKVAK